MYTSAKQLHAVAGTNNTQDLLLAQATWIISILLIVVIVWPCGLSSAFFIKLLLLLEHLFCGSITSTAQAVFIFLFILSVQQKSRGRANVRSIFASNH